MLNSHLGAAEKTDMRIDFKFRHVPPSDDLTEYVLGRTDRLEKYEMKPVRAEFTFSTQKTSERVDVHIRGQNLEIHAHADAENFFMAVDQVIAKVARQLARKKAKVQSHKAPGLKVS